MLGFKKNNIEQWENWYYQEKYNEKYFLKMMKLYQLYIAKEENKILGVILIKDKDTCYWHDNKKSYYLHHFVTKIGYKGLGSKMLLFIEDLTRKNGIESLRLESMKINKKLSKYYENQGFNNKGEGEIPYSYI